MNDSRLLPPTPRSSNPEGPSHRRWAAIASLIVVVGSGLVVHTVLPESAACDIAGDALYAVAVYAAIAAVAPRVRPAIVAAIAASWCVAIELFQLTGIPTRAGAVFPPAMLVLGTVFDLRDLVIYPLAVGGAWLLDSVVAHAVAPR